MARSQATKQLHRETKSQAMATGRKQTIWLVACVSITCYLRQVVQCDSTSGGAPLGIAFARDERPFLVPQRGRQQYESNERHRAPDDEDHWQSKRLRLIEPDGEVSEEERARLNHIRELLDAITGTIPTSPGRPRSPQRPTLVETGTGGRQQAAPAPRLNRPLARSTGVPARAQRRQGKPGDRSTDGRASSRDPAGARGLVWPAESANVQNQKASRLAPLPSNLSHWRALEEQLGAKFNPLSMGPFGSGHLFQAEQVARKSHRSGSEEVPMQAPILSMLPAGDYETKRVENSRGWNNLRGMWGKRSPGENNRRPHETELDGEARQALSSLLMAQQQQQQQQKIEPGDEMGGDASADYIGAEGKGQRQWRPIMSAGEPLINSM